jgi:hypothetical protein
VRHHQSLPSTTHTVELSQLADVNERLKHRSGSEITAAELGLEGAKQLSGGADGGLPGSAVLIRVCWDGPPEYPYIHGHFVVADTRAAPIVDLHTAALRKISRRLGMRQQQWGA